MPERAPDRSKTTDRNLSSSTEMPFQAIPARPVPSAVPTQRTAATTVARLGGTVCTPGADASGYRIVARGSAGKVLRGQVRMCTLADLACHPSDHVAGELINTATSTIGRTGRQPNWAMHSVTHPRRPFSNKNGPATVRPVADPRLGGNETRFRRPSASYAARSSNCCRY